MKTWPLILAAALLLSGCAKDIYDKPGGSPAEFNQDQGACQMYALSMPQEVAPQMAPVYTAQTNVVGNTAYTTVQQQPNPGQGFADLGATLGNIARQRAAMRACMASKGYTLEQK